jgi:CheY-like chemotaxis protein
MQNLQNGHKLPNGRIAPTASDPSDVARLKARIDELEDLCGELYEMGAAIGVPQVFLNKLWTVAAHGNEPHAFDVPFAVRQAGGAAIERPAVAHDEGLPDVRLIHSIARPTRSMSVPAGELAPLPERRRVMVVDDDPAFLEMVLMMLAHENYEVMSANSGPEALELMTEPIDLLITDFVMPVMNGRELAHETHKRFPGVKILYETGFTDLLFKNQKETEPYASFLEKPYSARGLIEAARLALFGYIQPSAAEKSA